MNKTMIRLMTLFTTLMLAVLITGGCSSGSISEGNETEASPVSSANSDDSKESIRPSDQSSGTTQPDDSNQSTGNSGVKPLGEGNGASDSGDDDSAMSDSALEYVLMSTSMGDIVLELDREHAPISVANFLAYTQESKYDGTIFHRVMPNFMIQGGGLTSEMVKKRPMPPIKNEWQNGLKNTLGTLAMARLGGNPDSATNQFFINVKDNPSLDQPQPDGAGYAVFGKVVAGMAVVNRIRIFPTGRMAGRANVPLEPIIIQTVRRLHPDKAPEMIEAVNNATQQPAATNPEK